MCLFYYNENKDEEEWGDGTWNETFTYGWRGRKEHRVSAERASHAAQNINV